MSLMTFGWHFLCFARSILAQAKVLHAFRFLGNDALHELEVPDRQTFNSALDLLEQLMQMIYRIEQDGNRIIGQRQV